jgi:hypothetical protein
MAFNLRMRDSASSLSHQLLLLDLEVRPGMAKDRSPAANIDADCALISFKEMPITPVDTNHQALDVARGEIGGFAVQRTALINGSERRQEPVLLDVVEFDRFIWELG